MSRKKDRGPESKRARRIWALFNGSIPKDENGVSFDIHHRDGDWENNTPSNLEALSVRDHFLRHLSQGDFCAAWYIAQRLKLSAHDYANIRAKISKALTGRIISSEWRGKISKALTGRTWTPEQREKIPAALKGRKFPPEFGRDISVRKLGQRPSLESRMKMSIAQTGKKQSQETKDKRAAALRGKTRSAAAIAQTVATRRQRDNYKMSDATKKKISDSQRGKSRWPNGRSLEDIEKMKATKAARKTA